MRLAGLLHPLTTAGTSMLAVSSAEALDLPLRHAPSLGCFLGQVDLKSDDEDTRRECPRVQYVSSEHESECYDTLLIINSLPSHVRVYYVSTAGVEQKAYELEPGVRYQERTACPRDVWRARTLTGILVDEHRVGHLLDEAGWTFRIRPCATMGSGEHSPGSCQVTWAEQRHYATLGLSAGSDFAAVQKAFRKLSLAHHPDKGGDAEVMKWISEAYTALSSHYQCRLKSDDEALLQTQVAWKQRRVQQWSTPPPPPAPVVDGTDNYPNDISTGELVRDVLGIEDLGANANVYTLHGSWMVMTWSTCSVAGVYLARYCRHKNWWMTWHIKLMAVAAMGTMGFVAVAVSMVHEQFGGSHQKIGLLVGVWTALQASAGDYVHAVSASKRRTRHRWITLFHKVGGKALWALCVANIWLGFGLLDVDGWLRIIWGGWITLVMLVFGVSEVRLQTKRCSTQVDAKQACDQDSTVSEQTVLVAHLRERLAAQEQEIRELREKLTSS